MTRLVQETGDHEPAIGLVEMRARSAVRPYHGIKVHTTAENGGQHNVQNAESTVAGSAAARAKEERARGGGKNGQLRASDETLGSPVSWERRTRGPFFLMLPRNR